MKKFGFKPLGELYQKFSINWLLIGLVIVLGFSACSNDDDEKVAPTFPAKQTISVAAKQKYQLTFEAGAKWQLTSSAVWCHFPIDDNIEKGEYTLSGDAGKQTVTFYVTDGAQDYDALSKSYITLIMGGEKVIIADVIRNAKGRELKILDMDGKEITEINVGYNTYQSFKVQANFRFAATNRPEWVKIAGDAIVGSNKADVVAKIQVVEDAMYAKYEQKGVLTFSDDEGLATYNVPLVYKGMDRTAIVRTTPTANVWDWTVTRDGKDFNQGTGTTGAYKNSLPFTVAVFNDDYEVVCAEKFGIEYYFDADSWIHVSSEKGKLQLRVDAQDSYQKDDREGFVFVFPREEYDKIKNNLKKAIIDEEGNINYKYEQNNLLIQFVQKEKKVEEEKELQIFDQMSVNQEIPFTKLSDSEAEFYKSEYGAKSVFTMSGKDGSSIQILPFYTVASYSALYKGQNISADNCEQGEDAQGNSYVAVWGFERFTEDFIIILRDEMYANVKVVVIKP